MGRRDYPDAERIAKRAAGLRDSSNQSGLDTTSVNQYTQAHILPVKEKEDKAIGSGIVGSMVDRRANIEGGRPFGRVLALGGHDAEDHASGKLEPWLNTAVWLAEGDSDAWDLGVHNQQSIGRAWHVILPAPQFHSGKEYMDLVAEWNRRIDAEEDTKEIKEEMRVYRRDHFAIAWRYVDPVSVYADHDDEGMAEVYYFRKLSRGTIEERFPGADIEEKRQEFDVIEYANEVYVATVTPEGGGFLGVGKSKGAFLGEPWKHEMGCNPYVRIKRIPMRANERGYEYMGCAFHAREMVQSLDESMTDWRGGMRREAKSPLVYTLVPSVRTRYGIEDKDKIRPDKQGNLILYGHKEEGVEKVERGPTPTVNEQLGTYIGLVGMYADRTGAYMPQMLGEGPSGESAVHQSTARQSAITGELEVPHRHLQDGFAAICERVFRCVIALDKMLPEDADADMRKIVVRAEVSKHGSKEISVTAKDVKNYELMVRAKIKQNLPVNTGANVINLRELTDPDRPLITNATGLEMFLDKENPQEEEDKLFQQRMRQAGEQAYIESYAARAKLVVDEFSDEELARLAEKMQLMPETAQQAILGELGGEQGNRLMEQMARGAAGMGREGRGQRMSQLGGGAQQVPQEAVVG